MLKWLKKWVDQKRQIDELTGMLNNQIDQAVAMMKELQQDKVYWMKVDGTVRDAENALKKLEVAKNKMKWTPPEIILSLHDVEELNEQQLKKALKVIEKAKGVKR